jgi:hypothetical protein
VPSFAPRLPVLEMPRMAVAGKRDPTIAISAGNVAWISGVQGAAKPLDQPGEFLVYVGRRATSA